MSVGGDTESVSPHFVRFLTHLVLFLRQIGRTEVDAVGDSVIEAYVKVCLRPSTIVSNMLYIFSVKKAGFII